jgi:hypothetical protein
MPFYWELHNKDTGEIVVNDYPFTLDRLARVSANNYIKRNKWGQNNTIFILPSPVSYFRQYKINPNRTLENNDRLFIIDKHAPRLLDRLEQKTTSKREIHKECSDREAIITNVGLPTK